MRFTLLPNHFASAGTPKTLAEIAGLIAGCEVMPLLADFERDGTKEALLSAKAKLPAFATSGVLADKSRTTFSEYNGLVQLDWDKLQRADAEQIFQTVCTHPSTALAFISVSGHGVKCLVRTASISSASHKEAWQQASKVYAEYIAQNLDGWSPSLDKSTCDPSRLCYLAADPLCYFNERAVLLQIAAAQPASSRAEPRIYAKTDQRSRLALMWLAKGNAQGVLNQYDDYVRFVFACAREFGQSDTEAMLLCEDVCRQSDSFDPKNFEKKWTDRANQRGQGPDGNYIAALAWRAGWRPAKAEQVVEVEPVAASVVKAAQPEPKQESRDPFVILGFEKGDTVPAYIFYSRAANVVVKLTPAAMTEANLLTIAPASWWDVRFQNKRSFDVAGARSWLIEQGNAMGIYNPDRLRGRGVWLDDGRVVVHEGSHLIAQGQKRALGWLDSSFIYELGRKIDLGGDAQCSQDQAKRFLQLCESLSWEKQISGRLLAGWCVIAPIGGVLSWRPHIWVTGGAGTGKSWILDNIIRRVLGNTAIAVQGNTSEAGIRQLLQGDALPVVFDEGEGNGEKQAEQRIQSVLELVRSASFGDGGRIVKGGADGKVKTYMIRSCFAFASIVPQATNRADMSRITLLGLVQSRDRERFDRIKEERARLITDQFVKGLQARTIKNADVLLKNTETFGQAAATVLDDARQGDQLGAMLAGAFLLESTREVSFEEAKQFVLKHREALEVAITAKPDEFAILDHILEREVRVNSGAGQVVRSLADLIELERKGYEGEFLSHAEVNRSLRNMGVAIQPEGLAISSSHSSIKAALRGTVWAAAHQPVLLRIPGSRLLASCRFGMSNQRAVRIPWEALDGQ